GNRARRGAGGADRPRRESGGRGRPQGVDAPGRRGAAADGDRLFERWHRPFWHGARRADAAERGDLGTGERLGGVVEPVIGPAEVDRRYGAVRRAMDEHGLDAAVVAGSEYTGFEGAVTYMSGFVIVHRYAYVMLPREGDPSVVFSAEERYVCELGTSCVVDHVFT